MNIPQQQQQPPHLPAQTTTTTKPQTHPGVEITSVLCFVCEFMHPPQWECPEMRSEVKLRLALDRLRQGVGIEGLGPQAVEARRAFLGEKLRRVRGGSSLSNGTTPGGNNGIGNAVGVANGGTGTGTGMMGMGMG
jgi:hypothetical protein